MGSQQSRPSSTRTRKSSIRSFNGSIRSRRSLKLKQQQQQQPLPPSLQQQHKDLSTPATTGTTVATLPKKQPYQLSQLPQQLNQKQQCDAPLPLGQHLQPQYQRHPRHRTRRTSSSPPSRSHLSRTYSVLSSSSSSMSSMAWSGGLFSQLEGMCSNITSATDFSSHHSSIIHQPKETWPELMPSIPTSIKRPAPTASEILAQLESRPDDAYIIFKLVLSPDNKAEFFQAAFAWLKQHPESNIAAVYVARCLLDGWGVSANPTSGLSQLKHLATTKGAWEAYLPLAEYYRDNHAHQDAIHWYTRAANIDEKEIAGMAQYRLGELSASSEEDLGLGWFQKSAKNGNRFGQYIMGMYYQSDGAQDHVLSQQYFLASAEQGFTDAQCALGIFLFEEAQNPVEGRIWIDRAAEQNNGRALVFLGEFYEAQGLYEQAAEFYKTAAVVADDARAQYHVGLQYRRGSMGLPQDYKEAVKYLSRSARHDYAPAQRVLGLMYTEGLVGNRKDDRMAFTLFHRAASHGDVRAMCAMGTIYEQKNQYDLALEQFRRATQIASPYRAAAQLSTGQLLLKMGRTGDAYDWFKQAASADNDTDTGERVACRNAQLVLARYLLQGWAPVAHDPSAGFQALQTLAATDDTAAVFYWLGACFEEGLPGVCEPDQAKAFDYYMKAAKAGHMDSAFQVALILATQRHDRVGAFPWYERAAAQGHRVAQYSAGLYYSKGVEGVQTDFKKARELFESSAQQGFVPAMTSLGILCRKSVARASNNGRNHHHHRKLRDQMVYWYQKAAAAGDAVAQRDLGMLFDAGLGVKQSYEAAFELLAKACQQKDARATLLLGSYYQNGLAVQVDSEKALALYDKAAKLGASTAFYAAAVVLQSQGEYDRAYKKYKQAAEDLSLVDSMAGKNSKMMLGRYILGYYYVDATAAVASATVGETAALGGPNAISSQNEQRQPVSVTDLGGLTVQDGFRLLFELGTIQEFPLVYFWLGNCYYDGLGVPRDYGKALEWYILAANKAKNVEAMMKVAVMYDLGQGAPVNTAEVLRYYQRAADEEHPEAQHKLGMAYWRGLYNVPINLGEAVLWFTHSASRYPGSCWALGRMALENGDQDVAIKWWHKAIAAGHTPSMRELASLLLQSSTSAAAAISEEDESSAMSVEAEGTVEQAMNLLASAVHSGDPEALVMLGKHYQQESTAAQQQPPLNGDIDEHEAEQLMQARTKQHDLSIRCFEQAAEMGHVEAMFLAAQSWHSQEQFAAALDHYERAANQGHALSRVMRARYQIAGYGGIDADPEAGYKELLKCAHEDSCVDAYNSLGQCHELGLGTVQDDRLALKWYLRSAEATQDAEAMFRIGQMHAYGRVPSSQEASSNKDIEALQWYRFACDSRNHPRAHYCIGLYYVHGIRDDTNNETLLEPDLATATDHFRQAAGQDDRDAMHELGQLLLFTKNRAPSPATDLKQNDGLTHGEGLEWLERAAQLGSIAAQCELGKLYHSGTDDVGVCQDFEKAYDYFCRAAQQGDDKTAALFLGTYYEHGIHVSPNTDLARNWYSLAADNGWWLAELALARLLHQQQTPASQSEAYTLFKAAKEHAATASPKNETTTTFSAATLMVALYELNGWAGVHTRPEAAAKTLLELAVQGEFQAFLAVAQCYETGYGLPEDKAKAFEWYGRIVTRPPGDDEGDEHDVAEAMFRLGRFYEHGWDVVTVDRAKSTDLYTLAAEHGCEEASLVLLHQKL